MTEQIRKPRFQGHEPFNRMLREDWIKAISLSPDSFDALLFRPVDEKALEDDDSYQAETVLELETHQDSLVYGAPELVSVLDCPDEQDSFFVMDDGGENLGESLEPLLLRIGANAVPLGSVLEWDEETASGLRTVWWYVYKPIGYGSANIGTIYACIPMRDFNVPATSEEVEPIPEPESTNTDDIESESESAIDGDLIEL